MVSSVTLPRHRRAGFTLVELLVVIGIIAVLVGILLPALSRARQSASSLACQANLRTIGQAIGMYATQSKGVFPPGYYDIVPPIPPGNQTVVRWVDLLRCCALDQIAHQSQDPSGLDASRERM